MEKGQPSASRWRRPDPAPFTNGLALLLVPHRRGPAVTWPHHHGRLGKREDLGFRCSGASRRGVATWQVRPDPRCPGTEHVSAQHVHPPLVAHERHMARGMARHKTHFQLHFATCDGVLAWRKVKHWPPATGSIRTPRRSSATRGACDDRFPRSAGMQPRGSKSVGVLHPSDIP